MPGIEPWRCQDFLHNEKSTEYEIGPKSNVLEKTVLFFGDQELVDCNTKMKKGDTITLVCDVNTLGKIEEIFG